MRQKLNFLEGVCPITSGVKPTQHFIKRSSYQQSNMVVVVWWSGASRPGWLAIIKETMNSALYQKILKEMFVTSSSSALGLCSRTIIPNTPATPPLTGSRKKNKVLEWPSQSPDLNPTEMLWHDLKQSIHAQKPLQCGWIKTILQRRVGQNSSTAMWKTHCQVLQMLDCSCCCKGWHNQLFDLGGNYFLQSQVGLNSFFPLINEIIISKRHFVFTRVIFV